MSDQSTLSRPLDEAKQALARRDMREARNLLTPMVKEDPAGIASFFMAKLELHEGNYQAVPSLLDAFLMQRPKHAGALVLRARMHLALGEFADARREVGAALALDADLEPAHLLLEQITSRENTALAPKHVDIVDRAYLRARKRGVSKRMRAAAEALARMVPGPDWPDDTLQAKIAYFHHASDLDSAIRNYDPHLIDVSSRLGYVTWPKRIHEHVRGKSVLDVGCGFGGYGMGFLIGGARSYAGLDPVMKLDSTRAKNKRLRKWDDMGVTPLEIAQALPAIRLFECTAEDMPVQENFDTIALHNVTEHLMQLDLVFEGLTRLCHDETRIVFLHHNYYCWNGHHFSPNQPHQLDVNNPDHMQVCDWRHIDMLPDLSEDHYFSTHLNRVRLDEIHATTLRHFEIETWEEIPSSSATLERLTPQILERVKATIPDIARRDLQTNVVYCVAKPKNISPPQKRSRT